MKNYFNTWTDQNPRGKAGLRTYLSTPDQEKSLNPSPRSHIDTKLLWHRNSLPRLSSDYVCQEMDRKSNCLGGFSSAWSPWLTQSIHPPVHLFGHLELQPLRQSGPSCPPSSVVQNLASTAWLNPEAQLKLVTQQHQCLQQTSHRVHPLTPQRALCMSISLRLASN